MENFILNNPTNLHFGKDILDNLGETLSKYGKKILLMYGKGSIKKNGIYDKIVSQISDAGLQMTEYSGIKSNPIIEDADAAAEIGRKENVDVILAAGGGSVIDTAKVVALSIPVSFSGWKFVTREAKPEKAIPVITILTLAATGTEMNPFAVIQNEEEGKKASIGNPLIYPKHSFLDPQNTMSVPKDYTAYGIADLIAHCMEAYFGEGDASLSDRFAISTIREAMEYGPLLLNDLQNYTYREKILYASTCALNGMTTVGKKYGDWGVHSIGHVLSLLWDIPHGASLTIVYPAWIKFLADKIPDKITHLGKNLFSTHQVNDFIFKLEGFFKSIHCPVRLSEMQSNVNEDELLQMLIHNKAGGFVHAFTADDLRKIIKLML